MVKVLCTWAPAFLIKQSSVVYNQFNMAKRYEANFPKKKNCFKGLHLKKIILAQAICQKKILANQNPPPPTFLIVRP